MPVLTTKKNNTKNQSNTQTQGTKTQSQQVTTALNMSTNLNDEQIYLEIKDYIDSSKMACRNSFELNVGEITKKTFGCNGGTFGKYKSDKAGYDVRGHLKGQARRWAKDEVDIKKEEYLHNEFDKIDASTAFSSDNERQLAKDELEDTTEIRTMFYKKNLYSMVKEDVEDRLYKESSTISESIFSQYESQFNSDIKEQMIALYKDISQSKDHATVLDIISKKAGQLGVAVFKEKSDEILQKASDNAQARRSQVIKDLDGKEEKDKKGNVRANFDNVSSYEKVRDYVYDGQANSLDEKRNGIRDAIEQNDIEATSVSRGLLLFTRPLVGVVPKNGDSVAASGIIRIPIPQSPAYISFKLSGSVERDDDGYVEARFRVAIGAGGTAGIAKLSGDLGGFLEVKGETAQDLSMLLSYVMYRQFRESKIVNHHVTDTIWGMGNKTGEGKHKEAEARGASMEKSLFSEGNANSAIIGADVEFKADIGNMSAGVGGGVEAGAMIGREYSSTSFEKGNGKGRLGKMEDYKFLGQKSKGDIVERLSFHGAVGGAIAQGDVEAELNLRGLKIESADILLSMALKNTGGAFGANAGEKAIKVINDIIADLKDTSEGLKKIYSAYKAKKDKKKLDPLSDDAAKTGSDIGNITADISEQIKVIADSKNKLGEKIGKVSRTGQDIAAATNSTVLGAEYNWEPGSKGKLTFFVDSKKELTFDGFFAGITLEKSKRIFSFNTGDDFENLTEAFKKGKSGKERLNALKEGVAI